MLLVFFTLFFLHIQFTQFLTFSRYTERSDRRKQDLSEDWPTGWLQIERSEATSRGNEWMNRAVCLRCSQKVFNENEHSAWQSCSLMSSRGLLARIELRDCEKRVCRCVYKKYRYGHIFSHQVKNQPAGPEFKDYCRPALFLARKSF